MKTVLLQVVGSPVTEVLLAWRFVVASVFDLSCFGWDGLDKTKRFAHGGVIVA